MQRSVHCHHIKVLKLSVLSSFWFLINALVFRCSRLLNTVFIKTTRFQKHGAFIKQTSLD
ncbi:hypothetical protein EFU27_16160 [Vibrio cholerae]|nr:hypothetical protein [Vibrio cholerae]EGR1075601.1 hypothetical protein [Vibrio cholerae]EGR1102027.1 hypothetical protein [Vibrio cholerae]EGR2415169.1 hypothetical protein [Vibrio cholerae]EGR4454442.1 hypothetical protein [Vibrio cholerae]